MPEQGMYTIEVGYTCSNNCLFCPAPSGAGMLSLDEMKKFIDSHCKSDSVLILSGGEPTLHPDFTNVVEYAKKAGCGIELLLTNGRTFKDKAFAEKSIRAGIRSVCVLLYGPNASVHDGLTRSSDSFSEATAGIRNLLQLRDDGLPFIVKIKLLICSQNIEHLSDTVKFLNDKFSRPDEITIENITYTDDNLKNKTVLRLNEIAPYVARAVAIGVQHRQNIKIKQIPPCIFPNPEFYYGRTKIIPYETQTVYGYGRYKAPYKGIGVIKSKRCRECEADQFCGGIWTSYAKKLGFDELEPVKNNQASLKKPSWLKADSKT